MEFRKETERLECQRTRFCSANMINQITCITLANAYDIYTKCVEINYTVKASNFGAHVYFGLFYSSTRYRQKAS